MMSLTKYNYHSLEANRSYWSVSLFKEFNKCEACGFAQVRGGYKKEMTDALLIGSYVDAFFSGELGDFLDQYGDQMVSKRDGRLLAKFQHANDIIERVGRDPLMGAYLVGDKQVIETAELFGVPWKCKYDVLTDNRIVDLKTVKDFNDVYENGYGWRSWIEYWGYDIQGAVYQKIHELNTGKKLPFYIAAVTKEKVPDIDIIEIPQHILDTALKLVEAKIERFDLIKNWEVEPIRCGRCDFCKETKILKAPRVYEIKEAQ